MAPKKNTRAAAPKGRSKASASASASTKETTSATAKSRVAKPARKNTRGAAKKPTPTASKSTKATTKSTTAFKRAKASATTSAPSSRTTSRANTSAATASSSRAKPKTAKATTTKKGARAKPEASETNAVASKKRGRDEPEDIVEGEPATRKRRLKAKSPAVKEAEPSVKRRPAAPKRRAATINKAPSQKLKVFVFGEGSSGELGLGHLHEQAKKVIDVKRPRLNPNLLSENVGVVQVAAGGMHVVALTHDNKILTWGVNDQGALGRSTKSGEQLKSIDAEDSDDEDELNSGLNPLESTPGEVDYINVPEGTIFTKVAAGDSVTIALTSTGLVYGCGTFRANDGVLGFSKEVKVQETLVPIPKLRNVADIDCGANHVLALDTKGSVFAFGSGQQNQLGRRMIERTMLNGLTPSEFGLPRGKVQHIAACSNHSFAIDKSGEVWAWGANSFGQTGVPEDVGVDSATVPKPQRVEALRGKSVSSIAGGNHHSLAATTSGSVLAWGRCDGGQAGMDLDDIPDDHFIKNDDDGKPNRRLLLVPTTLPEPEDVAMITSSSDHCIAVTHNGKAYSWGFSENYQTGQGQTGDVKEATMIDNTAVRNEKINWAGTGGQYSMLASAMEGVVHNAVAQQSEGEKPIINGTETQKNGDGSITVDTTEEKAAELNGNQADTNDVENGENTEEQQPESTA